MKVELCLKHAGIEIRWGGGVTSIVGCPAVIGGGEKSNEVALCKALKAVHHALMCTHYHLQVVVLQAGKW